MIKRFKNWIITFFIGSAVLAGGYAMLPDDKELILGGDEKTINEKYLLADEIKSKYKLEKASFIKEAKDENAIQIEIGDKTKDNFKPKLTLRKWDDEVNFDIQFIENEIGTESIDLIGDKIKYSKGNIDIEFYDYDKGYKMVWFLKKKPKTNKVEFSIQSKGLDFFYQPSLKEEHEIGKEGAVEITDTDVKDKDGKVICHRPENVVGSYAVYHNGNPTNWVGGKEYKAGKFGHIYRPHLYDANGLEAWGILHIENGIYSVEIPQDFLDKAVYPIKSNDTFGYESNAETYSSTDDWMKGSVFLGGAGELTKISALVFTSMYTDTKCAIYKHSDNTKVAETNISNTTQEGHKEWVDYTFASNPTIEAINYVLVETQDYVYIGPEGIYYDAGDTDQGHIEDITLMTFPDTASFTHENNIYSIYATYTPSGGADRRIIITQ